MPAEPAQTQVIPFGSRGLVLKQDPAQLGQGTYQELSNCDSVLEGTVNVRNGDQRITNNSSFDSGSVAYINQIGSLAAVTTARYAGSAAGKIYRNSFSAIPPGPSTTVPFTSVATGIGSTPFTQINFNGGDTGRPFAYFACESKMLKDDGLTFNPLENWGIVQPTIPAISSFAAVTIIPFVQIAAASTRFLATVNGTPSGTAPGLLTITYNTPSTGSMVDGMEVTMGSGFVAIVQNSTATTFQAYCPSVPTSGSNISGGYSTISTPTTDFTSGSIFPVNAAFNGVALDAYASSDLLHVAFSTSNANAITDLRIRVLLNGSTSDYYEKSISASSIQSTISTAMNAYTQLETIAAQVNLNIYGPYNIDNELINQLVPYNLVPISPASPSVLAWTEIDIPKGQFVPVGLAGTGAFNWSNVTGIETYYTASTTITVNVSSIYFHGGYGPNGQQISATTPLEPYTYVYTYRNPSVGIESNPSPIMISNNAISPQQQQVAVKVTGTGDAQVTGSGSIAIYRSGGSYADSYYRQVGFIANPGANTTAVFLDSVSDETITGANTALFDNDPPVTSGLPFPIVQAITVISGSGAANQTVTITVSPGWAGVTGNPTPTVGSIVSLSGGLNSEITVVNSVPSNTQITCYIQYAHATGEMIEIDSLVGQPCYLGCSAFGSIFLAGDVNNPETLYQSKVGRPESFPVENLETQTGNQITVGTPSDRIMAVLEFSGQLYCFNLEHIYYIPIFVGTMESPQQTPAERGLVASQAWCKVDNEIWYLSYDGIYSWNGGTSQKRSEAVDQLFKGLTIGKYAPINMSDPSSYSMSYFQNEVRLSYVDTNVVPNVLVYNTIHDRWRIDFTYDNQSSATPSFVTAQYTEEDIGILFRAKQIPGGNSFLYIDDNNATSDGWFATESDGAAINFAATPASYMPGGVSLNKQFSDVIVDMDNDGTVLDLAAYYDYSSTPDSNDQFTIAAGSSQGRRRVVQSLQNGFGKEAYAMTLRYSGSSNHGCTLYSFAYNAIQLTQIQVGRAFDWDDLGYPHDKRLYQMQITYDIPPGQSQVVSMDTITGVVGAQIINTAVQTFTLTPPTGTFTGPTHLTASFPIADETIIKKVRIRPTVESSYLFKIWGYTFEPFERYPPDVTLFTEWLDFGYVFYKYAQQIVLDVNTNGIQGTFSLYADGAGSPSATFNVTSTPDDRKRIFTLPPNISGKKFRLTSSAGSGGKFQLFNEKDWLIWLPADRGPVSQTYDWDYLEWPYDKKLIRVTFEYNTFGNSTTMQMDTITGINGDTTNTNAFQFTFAGSGRSLQTFEFPDDTYAKMIRFYPVSDQFQLQEWKYKFDKIDYPADVSLFTDYSDFGWPCEKIARNLILVINTGGVACSVSLVADGTVMQTFSVTSTIDNRIPMILACNSNLIGRLWKLELTPGSGGQSQLFSWKLDYVKEPCAVTYYDSYETDMGYEGWKWLWQGWIHYAAPSSITLTFYVEDDVQFYQVTLPSQANRDMQRFYFPALQFDNSTPVLNKSRIYRMTITSFSPFKLYADSRIEFGAVGADRRMSFKQFSLTAEQQNVVQPPMVSAGALK